LIIQTLHFSCAARSSISSSGERGASIFINPKQLYSSLEIYFLHWRALFVFICFFKFGRTTLAIFHNSPFYLCICTQQPGARWLAYGPLSPIDFQIQQQGVVFFNLHLQERERE
jgi:hypothetical protein